MYVSDLALTDFRSYKSVVVQFPPGVVILQGNNGRGKTNLVEGMAYLAAFSSHRASSSANLVRVGEGPEDVPAGAVVRARLQRGDRSHLLELEVARGRANRARVNKAAVPPRDLLGILRVVVFAPEDLLVLRGDPGGRRRFLDDVVVMLKPHYRGILQDYDRVARQRAATLKELGGQVRRGRPLSPEQEVVLEVWDRKLAGLSADVVVHRLAVVDAMAPLATQIYRDITDDDREAQLGYVSTLLEREVGAEGPLVAAAHRPRVEAGRLVDAKEDRRQEIARKFLNQATASRDQELRRGVNLVGAHRDDMSVHLDGLPVRGFASHGELWSSALMLRLAELRILMEEGRSPVLVLDDVFAELDPTRRERLASLVSDVRQVIVTSAVPTDLPTGLNGHLFHVSRGEDGWSVVEELGSARAGGGEQGDQ